MHEASLKKSRIRLIKSLDVKKFRVEHGLFVAEGDKLVRELLSSTLEVAAVFALQEWISENKSELDQATPEMVPVSHDELRRISFLKTPNQVLALVRISGKKFNPEALNNQLSLYLDNIQDPGNFGTIIRIADWFGIRNIICTPGSADLFNPKVVQATMGAIARIRVDYLEPAEFFERVRLQHIPVYGAFLGGENIYHTALPQEAVVVMGNESKGISAEVAGHIGCRITIPSYPPGAVNSESLNVAAATAVICAEFRRQAIIRG